MDYQNEKMILLCLLKVYASTWFISLLCVPSMQSAWEYGLMGDEKKKTFS